MKERSAVSSNIGQLIVASAIIDDTVGWVTIAVTFSLAEPAAEAVAAVKRNRTAIAACQRQASFKTIFRTAPANRERLIKDLFQKVCA